MKHTAAAVIFALAATLRLTAQATPTLAETEAWLEHEAAPLLDVPGGVHLRECVLSWTNKRGTAMVPLKDLDPRATIIEVESWTIKLRARHDAGEPIQLLPIKKDKKTKTTFREAWLVARDAKAAMRVSDAIQHAMVLCGAPVSPF